LSDTQVGRLNDETDTNGFSFNTGTETAGGTGRLCFLFPRLMDIDAYFWRDDDFGNNRITPGAFAKSSDTTNGLDGTWTTVSGAFARTPGEATVPSYRSGIDSVTSLGVRAVRFSMTMQNNYNFNSVTTVHLFGEPAAGENTDYLSIWHPTLDERVDAAYFDWGNVPRGSSADLTFRVKNLSTTLTAEAPRVAMDVLTDAPTHSVPGWHEISKGGTFAAQQTLADIGPGDISAETLTLRRTTPSDADLSVWAFRVFAESTTWS
jgi:hypothetical protein